MKMKKTSDASVPFLIGSDGRIYINSALLKASTVTETKITYRLPPA
ncbi:hypothetical protein QE391_001940 [Pseudomonas fluorescens]|nr:hypothetical protein [Pseudomonas fluorescens]